MPIYQTTLSGLPSPNRQRCVIRRHNEIRDVTTSRLGEVTQNVEGDGRVFNPLASCNRNKQMKAVYQQHEREKQRVCDQRVREVERGTFTPLVLTATGGMGPSALIFFQKLAGMIAAKEGTPIKR